FWGYEYFPASRPALDNTLPNNPKFPRMARWKGAHRFTSAAYIRLCLDEATVDS
ncbi:hypothetical protein MKX01_022648, partial [Papaver californicum]